MCCKDVLFQNLRLYILCDLAVLINIRCMSYTKEITSVTNQPGMRFRNIIITA
jgi:hypothetical protein